MDAGDLVVREQADALTVGLRVQPRAGRNRIAGIYDGCLKISIAAAPVDDAANKECLKYMSHVLSVPAARLEIIGGAHARTKVLRVTGMTAVGFRELIRRYL